MCGTVRVRVCACACARVRVCAHVRTGMDVRRCAVHALVGERQCSHAPRCECTRTMSSLAFTKAPHH